MGNERHLTLARVAVASTAAGLPDDRLADVDCDAMASAPGGPRARATEIPYDMLSVDAICGPICAVPVGELADTDAHLYLWSTRRLFREGDAAKVARAWGFNPIGEIIWGLRNPGMGTRAVANDHEPVPVATRGSLPFTVDKPMGVHFWRQLYVGGDKVHSAKPDAFLDYVEASSPGPYVELFARRAHFGWDYAGDGSLGTVDVAGLRAPGEKAA